MKRLQEVDINTKEYWDKAQTCVGDFGLRQIKYLELAGSGESIIELGCGLSPMLDHAELFEERWGVDFSEETITKAQELYPKVKYTCADVTNTGINEQFDAVVAGEVIEHLEKPELFIKEMERLCRVGGVMILSTPNLEFLDPEHLWQFYEQDFMDWGFEVETVHSERFPGRSYIFSWKRKK